MPTKSQFPVAGNDSCFLPATKSMPEEVVPVPGTPRIQHGVEEAVDADRYQRRQGRKGVMAGNFPSPGLPLVIYTDLDGSLLDHDNYNLEPARPAIERLQSLNVPVIAVTSKTLCEVEYLFGSKLKIRTPVIAENGGVIAFPTGYFPVLKNFRAAEKYVVREVKPDYAFISETLAELRQIHGFVFYGFHDMCELQVSELTGLTHEESARAKWRRCSEPIIWRDSDNRLDEFKHLVAQQGLQTTQGGRFLHITGKFDKGTGIQAVNNLYNEFGLVGHTTLALGDSPNDIPMLQQADVAIAIRRFDGKHLSSVSSHATYLTEKSGPAGWNESVMNYLDMQLAIHDSQRTAHG